MFRLSLLILLCQIPAYSGIPQWWSKGRVEVTVMVIYNHNLYNSEVQTLFNDYGKRHGISSNHMPVHRIKECYKTNGSPARFEGRVTNCYDFQTYLLHLGKWMSNEGWEMIHVKCDQLHFSVCLIDYCSPKNYTNLANCAYNTAV